MEEAPGDGSDIVEELEGDDCSRVVECSGSDEELEVGVDLFGRAVGDSPVVQAVST